MEKELLKISFIISILGIFLLLLLANFFPLKQVNSYQDLVLNKKVETIGKIILVDSFNEFNIIKLDNNITITCNKCYFKENEKIKVKGEVSKYKNQLQISVESINIL